MPVFLPDNVPSPRIVSNEKIKIKVKSCYRTTALDLKNFDVMKNQERRK